MTPVHSPPTYTTAIMPPTDVVIFASAQFIFQLPPRPFKNSIQILFSHPTCLKPSSGSLFQESKRQKPCMWSTRPCHSPASSPALASLPLCSSHCGPACSFLDAAPLRPKCFYLPLYLVNSIHSYFKHCLLRKEAPQPGLCYSLSCGCGD